MSQNIPPVKLQNNFSDMEKPVVHKFPPENKKCGNWIKKVGVEQMLRRLVFLRKAALYRGFFNNNIHNDYTSDGK